VRAYHTANGDLRIGRTIATTAAVGLLLLGLLFAWPFKKVQQSYVGLSYGGGIVEGQHFQGERVGPTSLFFNGWGDHLFLYPATQRNYIISKNTFEGDRGVADSITALNADGVPVDYQVAVYFKLNLDKLRQFHENIGIKYHAWCDGSAVNCSDGWENMLNDSFRQQLENALQIVTRQYHTDDFLLPDTVRTIQNSVAQDLKDNVNGVLGDDYFCGPAYVQGTGNCPDFKLVLKKPELPSAVVQRYSEVQESRIEIQTRQNEVKQADLQARAIDKLNKALSSAQSADAYVLLKAIESGNIDFWVIPENGNLTLQTPQRTSP
jgi:regulator of protease activity HflC (stomatin/prohibitin superfamily)